MGVKCDVLQPLQEPPLVTWCGRVTGEGRRLPTQVLSSAGWQLVS